MLSNREKELVTLAYYQGTCDNQLLSDPKTDEKMIREAVKIATEKVLEELGLNLPDASEFNAFMDELDEITKILLKENDF
jgi:hypothetical protein